MDRDRFEALQRLVDARLHRPDAAVKASMRGRGTFFAVADPLAKATWEWPEAGLGAEGLVARVDILITSRYLINHEPGLCSVAFFAEGICVRALRLDQNLMPTGHTAPGLEGCNLAQFE
jgi:hypothetical protein